MINNNSITITFTTFLMMTITMVEFISHVHNKYSINYYICNNEYLLQN